MKSTFIAVALATLVAGKAHAAVTEFVIYKDNDFKGAQQVVKGEVAHLEDGFAREAASLVVRGGSWEVCDRNHFRGDCRVLAEGEYPRLEPGWQKRIVSVRFLGRDAAPAGAVELFGQGDFRGTPVRVHDSVRDLAERNFNGRAASAIVHAGTWVACSEPNFHGRCTVLAPGRHAGLAELGNRVASLRQLK